MGFAQRMHCLADEARKNTDPIPAWSLDCVTTAQGGAVVSGFFSSPYRIERVADQFGFQFMPAPWYRLDRSDGGTGAHDRAALVQRHCETENRDRIIAGFAQRQPNVHRTALRTRNDDAPYELTRREARSDLKKMAERYPVPSLRPLQLDLGIKAQKRGYQIGGGEIGSAQISADRCDLPDGRICCVAGGQGECAAIGYRGKPAYELSVGGARPYTDVAVVYGHVVQRGDLTDRYIKEMPFLTQRRPHDPGRARQRRRLTPALGERSDGIVKRRCHIEPGFRLSRQTTRP